MFTVRQFSTYFLGLSLFLSCSASSQTQNVNRAAQPGLTVIRAARMLDVNSGRLISDPAIIVSGDKIINSGTRLDIPAGAKVIDLGDMTLLPGLIDAHTHVTYHFDENGLFGATGDASPEITLKYAEDNARRTVEAGFTTIRNLGAGQDVDIRLRDEIRDGKVVGPRMLVSGQPFTPDLLSGSNKADRLAIIRQFVTARIKEGVDVIKIFEGVNQFGGAL